MPRLPTLALVAALATVGVAAAVDALQAGEEPAREPPRPAAKKDARSPVVAQLRAAGIRGVLTYSDEGCRLRAVTLPELQAHPAPAGRACSFTYSAGNVFSAGPWVPDPSAFARVRCRAGTVEYAWPDGTLMARGRGCGPAWKPDGTLTAVREGAVVGLHPLPVGARPWRLAARTILSRREIERAFRGTPWARVGLVVERLIWLTNSQFAANLRIVAPTAFAGQELLTIFDGARLVGNAVGGFEDLWSLRASPRGRYVAARSERGVVVLGRDGPVGPLPLLGEAIAWSPDERWAAVVERARVSFFRMRDGWALPTRLPFRARDLVWR